MITRLTVMIVDDEAPTVNGLHFALKLNGFKNIINCTDSSKALSLIEKNDVRILLLDLWMPRVSGEEILKAVSEKYPHIFVIIITAIDDVNTAVKCLKMGARDYVVKPFEIEGLISRIKHLIEMDSLKNENISLRKALFTTPFKQSKAFDAIVTHSKKMLAIFQYIEAIASSNHPVLITGESGVGKELIASAIHQCSHRKGDFTPVNIAGLDDTLFSDTLFGHIKGAFSGAETTRDGLIMKAGVGTLFLDEIGDLTMNSQIKLLRLLQDKSFYQLGSDIPKKTDARIVAATNQDLTKLVREKKFRLDLFYRLQSHSIDVPPLRERKEDIPLLVTHFFKLEASDLMEKAKCFSQEALNLLQRYNFPGNIRELQGIVIDSIRLSSAAEIGMDSLTERLKLNEDFNVAELEDNSVVFSDQLPSLKEIEELLIEEALKRADQNQTVAARLLGISRRALNNRIVRKKLKYAG